MKKTALYNNLPDEVIKATKLKQGQAVVWRLTKIQPDPMNPGRWAIPTQNIPPIDKVYLKETDSWADIALVKSVDAKGEHTFWDIDFVPQSGGMITLIGGRAFDQELHTYLSLSNHNKGRENRDETKEILWEIVDNKAIAESERKSRNAKREALNIAFDLSPDDVRDYIAALGGDDSQPIETLRNRLETMADKDPEEFISLVNNKDVVIKAIVNRALGKGIISWIEDQSRFAWPGGEAILTTSRTGESVDEFVSYLKSNAKGEKVLGTIQKKLKGA